MDDRISLYIHIPFCVRKCAYCDFVSFPPDICGDDIKDRYIDKLIDELAFCSAVSGRKISTAYIGGGTPTSLSAFQLKRLFNGISKNFDIADEFSIEVNPATVDSEKIKILASYGINRISVGLQSIWVKELNLLGRAHDYKDFLNTLEIIQNSGFKNINVDVMAALPGATVDSWAKTLETVADMDIQHVSAYNLIIEEGTRFGEIYGCSPDSNSKYPSLPDEETEREMYHITNDILDSRGFRQYEISNYAKEGFSCRHNITYWRGGYYIGAGLSAAGHLPVEHWAAASNTDVRSVRYKNTSDIKKYLGFDFRPTDENPVLNIQGFYEESDAVTFVEAARELFIFGLRMNEGLDIEKAFNLANDPGFESEAKKAILKLTSEGLIEQNGSVIRLTDKGRDLENYVVSQFV